jgi:hypothetical protein
MTFRTQAPLALLLFVFGGLSVDGCSGSSDDPGPTGGASGGQLVGTGGSFLDPNALAGRCMGLTVEFGASCSTIDLICPDPGGSFCVCQGRSALSNQGTWDCNNVGPPPSSGGASPEGGQGGQGGVPIPQGGSDLGGDPQPNAGSEG